MRHRNNDLSEMQNEISNKHTELMSLEKEVGTSVGANINVSININGMGAGLIIPAGAGLIMPVGAGLFSRRLAIHMRKLH